MREAVIQAARATRQLVLGAALAFGSILFITVLLFTAAATVAVVGAILLPEAVLLIRRLAGAKRRLVTEWTGREIPEAYLPLTGPLLARLGAVARDPCTYADLRWMVLDYFYGWLGLLAVPLWIIGLVADGVWCGLLGRRPVVLPLIGRLAGLDAAWSTALLRPPRRARLTRRVAELTQTRAGAIAAHESELRRIERDLHDGTQARLVSLSMRIGMARRAVGGDDEAARRLLDDAQRQAEEALTELRHVVRGIHPPILSDRGLPGAVRALAAASGLDVTVIAGQLDEGPRAPAAVEAAAYFVVAEALTNAARHSGADRAEARLTRTPAGLRVTVRDDGKGGAPETAAAVSPEAGGSGLPGMRRRVAALDGTLTVTSPPGGPTIIEAELPCAW
jgi:signal transduction histidine kinase